MQNGQVEEVACGSVRSAPDVVDPPVLAGFQVRRILGRGGAGTVWLVVEAATGREYALKVLSAGGSPGAVECDEKDLPAPSSEVQMAGRAKNPHIVAVYAAVRTDCGVGLLMDYAAGGSLADLIAAGGPVGTGEAVTLLAPLAQALAYLHGEGTAHGDVAPGNILFSAEGKPMLTDLGLSRRVGVAAQDHGLLPGARPGTPGFAAPEPYDDESGGRLRAQGDMYSLGAVAWYALTGRVPGSGRQRPPLGVVAPEVPASLRSLIEEALSEDPQARPTAEEFSRMVLGAAAAVPLDLVGSVHAAVQPRLLTRRDLNAQQKRGKRSRTAGSGRRFDRRVIRSAVKIILLSLVLAGAAGAVASAVSPGSISVRTASSREDAAPLPSAPGEPVKATSPRADPDPRAAVATLAALRAKAFRVGDPRLLSAVNAPNSPAMKADSAVARRLAGSGHRLAGLSIGVRQVRVLPSALPRTAVVRLVSVISAYQVVDGGGNVVRVEPRPRVQRLEFVLESSTGRWRIMQIRDLDAAAASASRRAVPEKAGQIRTRLPSAGLATCVHC